MGTVSKPADPKMTHAKGNSSYTPDGGDLKAQLAWRKTCLQALTKEEYAFVSTKNAFMHYYLGLRTTVLYAMTAYMIYKCQHNFLLWLPLTCLQGAWLMNFVFLMHETVHQLIWNKRDSDLKIWLEDITGRFYGAFCGTSSRFFREYHGQHHHRFFRGTDDPKATYFVPHDGKWSTKMKYFGPGLIGIFKKLNQSVHSISEKTLGLRDVDRKVNGRAHLAFALACTYFGGPFLAFQLYFLPHMVFFPIWFMANRCGQHYCCDPNHAPLQSTPHAGGLWAELPNLYSNFHVEHHTFAEVPAYNLKYLNSLLTPRVYRKMDLPMFKLRHLVYGWLVKDYPHYRIWWDLAHDILYKVCKFSKS